MARETCVFRDRRGRMRCTECGNQIDICTCSMIDELAHKRLTSDEGQFLREVYAINALQPTHLFEHLVNQFGKVGLMLANNDTHEVHNSAIRYELALLAAGITRLAVQGTPEYPYPT